MKPSGFTHYPFLIAESDLWCEMDGFLHDSFLVRRWKQEI